MTSITEDITKAAREASIGINCWPRSDLDALRLSIARAIQSERHRCAVIARNWQPSSHQDEQYAANSIADKIMAGER